MYTRRKTKAHAGVFWYHIVTYKNLMTEARQDRISSQLPDDRESQDVDDFHTVEDREKLDRLQDFVEKQYDIRLSEPPSLYVLMRVDQFARLVPKDLVQRQALKKVETRLVFGGSGSGAGGFTPMDGRSLSLFFQPYFGEKQEYRERTPMSTGFQSPAILMHESTHLAEYKELVPTEAIKQAHKIIDSARESGSDAFMAEYSSSEYSEESDYACEVLTTITERYVDNPVKFITDMNNPNNVDEKKLAMLLIEHKALPSNALNMEAACRKLREANRRFIFEEAHDEISQSINELARMDADNLSAYLSSPYLGYELLAKEHQADFEKYEQRLSEIQLQLDSGDLTPEEEIETFKKRDQIRLLKMNLQNSLMKEAMSDSSKFSELLNRHPVVQNYSTLLTFFCENGIRPNVSRSVRDIIEHRERDVLAMDSNDLSQFMRSDVVEFMTILRNAAGVEFALQDVVETAEALDKNPNLLTKMRDPSMQEKLFSLQCEARFINYDNNVQNLANFILTGKLLRGSSWFEPYEHHM